MDYTSYTVEDFVTDESYLRYFFHEKEEDVHFWTEWVRQHPEKFDVIISANNYIEAFSIRLPDHEFQVEQERFAKALEELSNETGLYVAGEEGGVLADSNEYIPVRRSKNRWIKAVAIFMILVIIAVIYLSY